MAFVESVTMVKYSVFLEIGILKGHYFQRRQIGYSVATTAMILMKTRYKQKQSTKSCDPWSPLPLLSQFTMLTSYDTFL